MEFVFVVPRELLFPECYPQGFTPFGAGMVYAEFAARAFEHGFFIERRHAEREPRLKQVIPYSLVARGNEVLLMRRLGTGGEERLHDKLSIGVGGHINPVDASQGLERVLHAATRREVEEELHLEGPWEARPLGILNDDANAVGAVHVGLVQLVGVQGNVDIRETDQLEGRLVDVDELERRSAEGANFETWSSMLVDRVGGWLAPETASVH
ncbi:MAG: hypothetical protein QF903_04770 [Planctomycetota bacterium]|jgi:predicted NUDIX family phosphoesterase|nr:hypothetical protein [Planctomycetota bacterium]MDP6763340.1 hypothetical protein [Planctomycetota bacterium]MDP6988769.1 hypothetical protein [Planctomycetota bacterium]